MTLRVDAVVLAGGRNSAEMQAATGVDNRALVRLGDRTMLAWVISALRGANCISSILVVGDVPGGEGYQVIPPGETLVDNLFAGIRAAGQKPGKLSILAVTSDIPFLTPAAVEDFVARAMTTGADFCYPIIPLAACTARYPQMKRTALKVREGTFTGGNLILLNPRAIVEHRATILRAYAARKRPLGLGQMLGWSLLARVALAQAFRPGLVTVATLESGVSRLLGCRAAAVRTEYAEIGTDVDKPDDVAYAREQMPQETS